MSVWTRQIEGSGTGRRHRLEQERNQARLRRIEHLQAEVREQVEPELGPQGRPMGDTALAVWRRRRVDSYLTLPPASRGWRTWCAWSRPQRALVPVAAAVLWPVAVLPLRMAGFASTDVTLWGIVALMALVPVAFLAPPARAGRFVGLPDRPGPAWSGSRRAARLRRMGLLGAMALITVLVALVAIRPASPGVGDDQPSVLTAADRLVVEQTVARACGADVSVRVAPLTGDRYSAVLPNGSMTRVEVVFTSRRAIGAGAGFGRVVGPQPVC